MNVHFIYKCRACGAHFSKGSLGTFEQADAEFAAIRIGAPRESGLGLTGGHHDCKVLKKGLADLIGIGDDPAAYVQKTTA